MDNMPVVDHLVVFARWGSTSARQRREKGAADEDVQPIVERAHPEPVADQARGHGVEHLAQREAA
jgi:hypothetical protein